jgi:hypothetical protein
MEVRGKGNRKKKNESLYRFVLLPLIYKINPSFSPILDPPLIIIDD